MIKEPHGYVKALPLKNDIRGEENVKRMIKVMQERELASYSVPLKFAFGKLSNTTARYRS